MPKRTPARARSCCLRSAGAAALLVLAWVTASPPALAAEAPEPARETAPSAAPAHSAAELVIRSLSLLGVNYKFGGNSPETGLDCSGLVRHVFREAIGLVLPRRSEEISREGEKVALDQLRPGDLVFFNTLRRTFSHVGIYIGNNQFVHAPSRGGQVRVEKFDSRYWIARFNGARRLAGSDGRGPGPSIEADAPVSGAYAALSVPALQRNSAPYAAPPAPALPSSFY